MPVPKGVEDFKADKKYGAATEIVMVNVRDAKEGTFLKELGLDATTRAYDEYSWLRQAP